MILQGDLLALDRMIIVDHILKNGCIRIPEKGNSDSAAIVKFNEMVLGEIIHK